MTGTLKLFGLLVLLAAGGISLFPGDLTVLGQTQTPIGNPAPRLELTLAFSGITQPTHIANAGDGTQRLFVVERAGRVLLVKNGTVLAMPFLDIRDRVGSAGGEQGLLSIAFPPQFANKGHFYVDYTDTSGNTAVSRFRLTANPDIADAGSEQLVLSVPQPFANHNGGQLAFGPNDGYLYVSLGDGGSANDPGNRAQNPGELLGKLLRLDVETGNPATYTVPPSNPYIQAAGYRPEIWALGLRNPWRFSFDRTGGDLYIADVGQSTREEVNFQPASSRGGENYGWRIFEGTRCTGLDGHCNPPERYSPPVSEYDHEQGCSVTGGHVMGGVYFYADLCSGRIWGLRRGSSGWQTTLLHQAPFTISTFGQGENGALYVADYGGGNIYSINSTWLFYIPLVLNGLAFP